MHEHECPCCGDIYECSGEAGDCRYPRKAYRMDCYMEADASEQTNIEAYMSRTSR